MRIVNKVHGGLSCICPCSRTLVSEAGKVQLEVLVLLVAARWWFLCRLVETQLRTESAAENSGHLLILCFFFTLLWRGVGLNLGDVISVVQQSIMWWQCSYSFLLEVYRRKPVAATPGSKPKISCLLFIRYTESSLEFSLRTILTLICADEHSSYAQPTVIFTWKSLISKITAGKGYIFISVLTVDTTTCILISTSDFW